MDLEGPCGPEQLGLGAFDIAAVDTPPEVLGGSLPRVRLLTPVDGTDAARYLLTMLRRTPENTDIMLIHVDRTDPDERSREALAQIALQILFKRERARPVERAPFCIEIRPNFVLPLPIGCAFVIWLRRSRRSLLPKPKNSAQKLEHPTASILHPDWRSSKEETKTRCTESYQWRCAG